MDTIGCGQPIITDHIITTTDIITTDSIMVGDGDAIGLVVMDIIMVIIMDTATATGMVIIMDIMLVITIIIMTTTHPITMAIEIM